MDKREELLKLVIDHPELFDFVNEIVLALMHHQHIRQEVEIKLA